MPGGTRKGLTVEAARRGGLAVTAALTVLLSGLIAPSAARAETTGATLPPLCVESELPAPTPTPSPTPDASTSESSTASPTPVDSPAPTESERPTPASSTDPIEEEVHTPVDPPDDDIVIARVTTEATSLFLSRCPPAVTNLHATAGMGQVLVEWDVPVTASRVVRDGVLPGDADEAPGDVLVSPDPVVEVSDEPTPNTDPSPDLAVGDGESSESEPAPSVSATASPTASASPSASAFPTPTLSAAAPEPAGGVKRFVVAVSPGGRVMEVSADERSLIVSGLRNGVQYSFTVFAVNVHGRGPEKSAEAMPVTGMEGEVAGVLVKFTGDVTTTRSVPGSDRVEVVDLEIDRQVAENVHLVEFSDAVDAITAAQIAQELEADPGVEWAEPDQFVFISQTDVESRAPPDDPLFPQEQWNLWGEYGVRLADGPEVINPAWSPDLGAGVKVAVIDTGITAHPDLEGQTVAGYDFVSNPANLAAPREPGGPDVDFDADDQPGWDADPTDPGDWRKVAPVRESTWHGTHIAGIIAARANNAEGITGLAPGARIQPVRAISWRGGLLSDIAAAITWASGGAIPGVPANTTPSKALNLSFTLQSVCTPALQAAITGANSRGSVVIAAAGNANDDVANYAPANCEGTIAVAATGRDGKRAPYSNYGPGIDLAAPGGSLTGESGVLSTSNPGYATRAGTSIAAAHVSAVAATFLGQSPGVTPADVRKQLTSKEAVRPFAGDSCDPKNAKHCGEGIASFAQVGSSEGIGAVWRLQGSDQLIAGWKSVTYGGGTFVAVSNRNSLRPIMTSPDGINWTIRSAPSSSNSEWRSLTYGNGVFVAVGYVYLERALIMTSPDGITWTSRTSAPGGSNEWQAVTYGECVFTAGALPSGCFVAVGSRGTNNRVMTSPDGVVWTARVSVDQTWRSVAFGNGTFVAVGDASVMTSPDGVTWTRRTAGSGSWMSVTYGEGLFVAVSLDRTVMTSPDGIVWTRRTAGVPSHPWRSVVFGSGTFVAVGDSGVMTSSNGITWTDRRSGVPSPGSSYAWYSVAFGNGLFASITDRTPYVMTSGVSPSAPTAVTAVAGDSQARVTWAAPETGGYPITEYTVTANPGGSVCVSVALTCTFTGLTNGTSYTFTVSATNEMGVGLASNPSPAVTPNPQTSNPTSGVSNEQSLNQRRPATAPPLAEPELAVRRPGSALVRVVDANGTPVSGELPITVVPLPRRDGKIVRAPSWDVELQGVEESGAPAPLNASGNLEVVQGRGLATSGRGFAPDSAVGVYLFSEPRTLGTLTTDARGVFSGTVPVPADVPVGVHTAQVSGYTPNGDVLIVSLGIEVAAPAVNPLVNPVPSRVQPLWWMPVTTVDGEVVVGAGSSGCSAVDGDGSPSRGRSLVFWNTGTCIFEVRSGGKTWKSYRVPIVTHALKTKGVQEMQTRQVWFTGSGQVREESGRKLSNAIPALQSSPAIYTYWIDSKDRTIQAATTRQHAELARQLRAQGPVEGVRTITVREPWRALFEPDAHDYVLIAWKPPPS